MTIGVKLGNKIGTKFITIIGLIFINISFILMMVNTNYALIFISMIIFGVGCGLSNLSVIKNCWEYYPNRLGLINGIILAGFKFSSSILYYIGDYLIINPKRKGMKEYYAIYSREVSDKFFNYIIFLAILVFILSIIAVCLTFNYQEEDPSKNEEFIGETISANNDSSVLCRYFCSKANCFLSIFCICGPCI